MYPLGKTDLPELHRPGVPRAPADAVGRPAELQGPLARHGVPPLDLGDDQVHADHGHVRVRARPRHRARRQLQVQGPRPDARGDARPVGDPDGRRGADVEVDARRHVRRHQRRRRPPAHPLALARLDLRAEHRARLGLRGRHLEDDAVRRAAAPGGPAGDPAGPLRGGRGRRRERAPAVLEDHAAAAQARRSS